MKRLYTKEEFAALETNEDEDVYKRLMVNNINNSSRSSSMSNGDGDDDERLLQGRCSSIMLMLPTTLSVSQKLKKLRDGYVDAMLSFSQHALHNAHL